jgi:D-arginine dehydrogenase
MAALFSDYGTVLMLEREGRLGYHTTGWSAALLTTNYGNPTISRLTEASRLFLETPPGDFSDTTLISPHGILTVAREDQVLSYVKSLAMADETQADICEVDVMEVQKIYPIMRRGYFERGMYMDVNAIHTGFLRQLKRNGRTMLCGMEVFSLERKKGFWVAHPLGGLHSAPILGNTAGAWPDQVGALAGVISIGSIP